MKEEYLPGRETMPAEKEEEVFAQSIPPLSLVVENLQPTSILFASGESPPPLVELHILYSSLLI